MIYTEAYHEFKGANTIMADKIQLGTVEHNKIIGYIGYLGSVDETITHTLGAKLDIQPKGIELPSDFILDINEELDEKNKPINVSISTKSSTLIKNLENYSVIKANTIAEIPESILFNMLQIKDKILDDQQNVELEDLYGDIDDTLTQLIMESLLLNIQKGNILTNHKYNNKPKETTPAAHSDRINNTLITIESEIVKSELIDNPKHAAIYAEVVSTIDYNLLLQHFKSSSDIGAEYFHRLDFTIQMTTQYDPNNQKYDITNISIVEIETKSMIEQKENQKRHGD